MQDLALLHSGKAASQTLSEALRVDFALLASALFNDLSQATYAQIKSLNKVGIVQRMAVTASLLFNDYGLEALTQLSSSASDTARGWAAYIIGQQTNKTLAQKLHEIQPYANDSHFGVREWAWMALRKDITLELEQAINILEEWTRNQSPYIRRFASEATRPRGVWAPHITALRQNPELGQMILEPLKSDPEKYVQDSVANWLNDAGKDHPDWVEALCVRWLKDSPTKETTHITKRARRRF